MINVEEIKGEEDKIIDFLNQGELTLEEKNEFINELVRLEKIGNLEIILAYDDFIIVDTKTFFDTYQVFTFEKIGPELFEVYREIVYFVASATNKSGENSNTNVRIGDGLYDFVGEQVTDDAVIEWWFTYEI